MGRRYVIISVVLIVFIILILPGTPRSEGPDHGAADVPNPLLDAPVNGEELGGLVGNRFIENKGQMADDEIRLYSIIDKGMLTFFDDGIVVTFYDGNAGACGSPGGFNVRYTFEGSNDVDVKGRSREKGEYNYITSRDRTRWATHIPCFAEVVYPDIYPGIDLVYQFVSGRLKYMFVISPSADPGNVVISIDGHNGLLVASEGSLIITTDRGSITDSGRATYYLDSPEETVPCSFDVIDDSSYTFSIGEYDRSRSLVIDPVVYGTLIGGSDKEMGVGLAVDSEGSVYVTGSSSSTDLPTTPGAFNGTYGKTFKAIYVLKLTSNLSELVYCTFIGDNGAGYSIDVDGSGCAYITGRSSSSAFPTTLNAPQPGYGGSYDVIVTKLTSDGSDLVYSTFLGGEEADWGIDIKVDDNGSAYITGDTGSTDFPVTNGAYQTRYGGGSVDGFVAKVAPDGSEFEYCTYFGGREYDRGIGIDVDPDGYAYVGGYSNSSDLNATPGVYNASRSGKQDVFVLKLDLDGSRPIFMTYIGPGSVDDIGIDDLGHITIGGDARAGYPTTAGSYSFTQLGAFVTKLTNEGDRLIYSAIVGWASTLGVAVEPNGTMYLTGETVRSDFPTTPNAYQHEHGGNRDIFLVVIQPSGQVYSTYLGTDRGEGVRDIGVDEDGVAYLTGYSHSPDLFVSSGAYCSTISGSNDIFVLKYTVDLESPVAIAGSDVTIDQHEVVLIDGTDSHDNRGIANWTWSFVYRGERLTFHGPHMTFRFDDAGTYLVTLNISDAQGNWAVDDVMVLVRDTTHPVARAGEDQTIEQHEEVELNGTGSTDNVDITAARWYFTYRGEVLSYDGMVVRFKIDDAGVYCVTLNVNDAKGYVGEDHLNITVTDTTHPVADAGEDIVAENGQWVQFNGSSSSDNVRVTIWTWSFAYDGEPIVMYGARPRFMIERTGEYLVLLEVMDKAGLTSQDNVTVVVVNSSPPTADAGDDRTIDLKVEMTLDGTGSDDNVGIINWTWSIDHGITQSNIYGETAVYTFLTLGDYEVTLTVTDGPGNQAMDTIIITVVDRVDPIPNAGPDIVIDQHQLARFDGTNSTDNGFIANWTWSYESEGVPILLYGRTPDSTIDLAGEYEVVMKVTDGFGNTAEDVVIVTVRDTEPPIARLPEDRAAFKGKSFTLDGSGSKDNVGVTTWTWTFIYDGRTTTLGGRVAEFTFENLGVYEVSLNVEDAAGNRDSATFEITVEEETMYNFYSWMIIVVIIAICLGVSVYFLRRSTRKQGY